MHNKQRDEIVIFSKYLSYTLNHVAEYGCNAFKPRSTQVKLPELRKQVLRKQACEWKTTVLNSLAVVYLREEAPGPPIHSQSHRGLFNRNDYLSLSLFVEDIPSHPRRISSHHIPSHTLPRHCHIIPLLLHHPFSAARSCPTKQIGVTRGSTGIQPILSFPSPKPLKGAIPCMLIIPDVARPKRKEGIEIVKLLFFFPPFPKSRCEASK
ncbi:hypothetical protein F4821DRAFT_243995 [Hypoxylon rubiginosum]|uniref:Uncharacterized protein n=1 Tax=Hypoxylon rubiginosum TaxID=110542 RepID=A0ACC0CTJ7_9PEZI|nr:hypothetical protein F4821DRAFT_243995 [Hypoxylon rubiginosum]